MEHRCSTRKPIAGDVIVECPRLGLVRTAMRDISLGGLFVETDAAVLPLNAPVSVVFDLPAGERGGGYCMQAMIVRHAPTGVGLMFLEPDADVIRSMRETLYRQTEADVSQSAETSPGGGGDAISRAGSSRK